MHAPQKYFCGALHMHAPLKVVFRFKKKGGRGPGQPDQASLLWSSAPPTTPAVPGRQWPPTTASARVLPVAALPGPVAGARPSPDAVARPPPPCPALPDPHGQQPRPGRSPSPCVARPPPPVPPWFGWWDPHERWTRLGKRREKGMGREETGMGTERGGGGEGCGGGRRAERWRLGEEAVSRRRGCRGAGRQK